MKKHELLEKAMKDYPSGTIAISTWSGEKFTSTGVFQINGNDVAGIDDRDNQWLVFEQDKGKWSEIVPDKKQNKPKEIVIDYPTIVLTVTKNGFKSVCKSDTRKITYDGEDIEKIYNAYKSLQ